MSEYEGEFAAYKSASSSESSSQKYAELNLSKESKQSDDLSEITHDGRKFKKITSDSLESLCIPAKLEYEHSREEGLKQIAAEKRESLEYSKEFLKKNEQRPLHKSLKGLFNVYCVCF